ncbi:hypothetical protein H257_09305 [Aphanomyces astaci]|uniref:Reverse transcriptase RNase H-like domain-containing protein n=1 Tax=Aphanomyces astaci TaxID=112090 RepID=W4GD24_APHAT|nr:hypothetical protein H257_09305 [Aphanomyces astaci]ETV76868.1 hypothetical protein H257_09305 [Aphanomyces astaci]|eukprot:XP_009833780.1 hypothetical protein H257_09305 [Aphanomyces astaci]
MKCAFKLQGSPWPRDDVGIPEGRPPYLCVADTSDFHWGGVVTQIPYDQVDRELDVHEPLMFLSGTFSGAAQGWTIVEKGAFSIVECLKRTDYLLHKPGGFALFTDHANLKFIFNPASVNSAIPWYTAAKRDRWALMVMGYDYTIYDIAEDGNVWADLFSGWGATSHLICPIVHVPMKISPLQNGDFIWPTMAEIGDAQFSAVELEEHRDDFSQFKWLWETDVANAQELARCLLEWFSVFASEESCKKSEEKCVEMAQLDVGDFVLYKDVWSISHSKLCATWHGPAQVVKATSAWIFEIKNLVTGIVCEPYSSQLKFKAENCLEVTEELLRHVTHNADGHVVDDFIDCR